MFIASVLELPEIDDPERGILPDAVVMVAQAAFVVVQADQHYTLYRKLKKNPNGFGGYHKILAELWRAGDSPTEPDQGVYGVAAEVATTAQLDPHSLRITFTQLKADPRAALFVPDYLTGDPCISSARSLSEVRPVARRDPS